MACECETYGHCAECRNGNRGWAAPDLADEIDADIARQEAIAEIVARLVDRLYGNEPGHDIARTLPEPGCNPA